MEPMVSAFWNAISEVKKPCAIFLHPNDYNKLREQWVRSSTGPEYLVSLYDLKYPEEGVGAVKVGTLLLRPGALAKHDPGGSIDVLVTGRSVPGSIPEGEFVVWGGDFSVDRPPSEAYHKAFTFPVDRSTIAGKPIHTTLPDVDDPRNQMEQASKDPLEGLRSAIAELKAQTITHTSKAPEESEGFSNKGGLKADGSQEQLTSMLSAASEIRPMPWQFTHAYLTSFSPLQKSVNLFDESLFNYRAPNFKWFAPYGVDRNRIDWSSLQVVRDHASDKPSDITDKNIYNEMMGLPNDPSVSQLVKHALDGMTKAAEERGFLRGIEEERKLHQEAGTITSTAQLTWDEIQEARAAEKLFVSADHCGSVPTDWLVSHRASREPKREEMESVAVLETQIAELKEKLVAAGRRLGDLEAELDKARMRLVACSVVAMSNTPKSAGANRKMAYEYSSSPAVQDVMHAVDREMALRADLIEAQAKIKELEGTSEEAQGVILGEHSEEDSSKGFGAILGVIGAVAAMAGAVGVVANPKGIARPQVVPQEEEEVPQEEENSFWSPQASG